MNVSALAEAAQQADGTREGVADALRGRRIADLLRLQNEVAQLLMSDGEPNAILATVLEAMGVGLNNCWSGLWVSDGMGSKFPLRNSWAPFGDGLEAEAIVWTPATVELRQATEAGAILVGDEFADAFSERAQTARAAGFSGHLAVPILGSAGVFGFWEFFWQHEEYLNGTEREWLTTSARILARYLERQRDRKKLEESENHYRLLFDNNPCPMWIGDRHLTTMKAANQAALTLLEYSQSEFLALNGAALREPDQAKAFLEMIASLGGGEMLPQRHWRLCTRSGKILEVDLAYSLFDWQGSPSLLVMANDVTERMRLEGEREAMALQLRQSQKLESIGQLAAGIAHEINTPGQYVGDNLRFLQDSFAELDSVLALQQDLLELVSPDATKDGPSGELASPLDILARELRVRSETVELEYLRAEIPSAIGQALEGIAQVTSIVSAMKEFSHPGKKEKALADLTKAIASVVVVSRNEWKYAADLVTEFDPALPSVPCLISEVNQVVLNLIVNASHAIQEKSKSGDKGTISIRTKRMDGWVQIEVEDTGGGIPEQARHRIFEPFFTTKEVGRGTGQGLAIARSVIVDKHGGTLTFETKTGVGTTFFIRLPLVATEKDALVELAAS